MATKAAGDVVFDYEGALGLARGLWLLADHFEQFGGDRELASSVAATGWSGRFASQYSERRGDERTSTGVVIDALRGDARLWAQAWASAMNAQNKVLWARHHDYLKNNRSTLESVGDFFGGFTDNTPHPLPVAVPGAPHFSATSSLVTYS